MLALRPGRAGRPPVLRHRRLASSSRNTEGTTRSKKRWDNDEQNRQFLLERVLHSTASTPSSNDLNGFYNLSKRDFAKAGALGLLQRYDDSPSKMLMSLFPSHQWRPWKFRGGPPKGWWRVPANQRTFLFDYLSSLRPHNPPVTTATINQDDIYSLRQDQLRKSHGTGLLNHYKSLSKMAPVLFPEYKWLPWKFTKVPPRFWTAGGPALGQANQRDFLYWIASHELQLGSSSTAPPPLEWFYRLRKAGVYFFPGGSFFLQRYGSSIQKMLSALFPSHKWQSWRFHRPEQRARAKTAAQLRSALATDPGLHSSDAAAFFLLVDNTVTGDSNLSVARKALLARFPQFAGPALVRQMAFATLLHDLFPNSSAEIGKRWSRGAERFELDLLLTDQANQRLAFEYQGEHHYFDILVYGQQKRIEAQDAYKALVCALNGIRLFELPFWLPASIVSAAGSRSILDFVVPLPKDKVSTLPNSLRSAGEEFGLKLRALVASV